MAVLVLPAARLHVGQIGASGRLGVTLRPELATGHDAGQEALLLLGAAEADQGRSDQSFADMSQPPRPAGARIFLVKDHLLFDRQSASAGRFRPADAGPAAGRQFALPGLAQFGKGFLVARTAAKAQRLEIAAQVIAHPCGHFGAEELVGVRRRRRCVACIPLARSRTRSVFQQIVHNGLAQRFGRTEPVRARLGALEVELRIVFPGEADAAVQLNRFLSAKERSLGGQGPRHRTFAFQRVQRRLAFHELGRTEHGGTQRFHAHHHFGAAMLDGLKRGNRAAELLALHHMGQRQIEAALRAAEQFGGQIQACPRRSQPESGLAAGRIVQTIKL